MKWGKLHVLAYLNEQTKRYYKPNDLLVSRLDHNKCNGACYWLKLAHVVWPLPGAREKSGTLMVFQPDPVDFNSRHNPSQAFTEKHVSYPRLTATQCTRNRFHWTFAVFARHLIEFNCSSSSDILKFVRLVCRDHRILCSLVFC